jgi:hypothetical protein
MTKGLWPVRAGFLPTWEVGLQLATQRRIVDKGRIPLRCLFRRL